MPLSSRVDRPQAIVRGIEQSILNSQFSIYDPRVKKLLFILVLIFVAVFGWYTYSLRPVDAADSARRPVTITKGLSVSGIAALLEEKGVIRSARAFSLFARLHGAQTSLQAGDFVLHPSMSVPEVIDALRRGFSEEVKITIPEGYTVKDIDDLLTKKELTQPGEFVTCAQTCDLGEFAFLPVAAKGLAPRGGHLEGYLFPDTYYVVRDGFTSKSFLVRLLGT